MTQQKLSIPATGFLRLPQILALIPVSKSTWWEGCRTGRFPKPIKLTKRTTVWRAEDIAAFIDRVGQQALVNDSENGYE